MVKKIFLFFLVLQACTLVNAQSRYPELIVGKWKFESFKFPNFIDPKSAEVKRATEAHKDVVYIFGADKKFSIVKAGFKQPLRKGIYGFIKNNKSFIVKDPRSKAETEFEIDYLTAERLNIYVNENGAPVGFFVRVK